MNFLKPKKPQEHHPPPQFNLHQTFTNLQNHILSLKPHLDSAFSNLQNHAQQALQSSLPFNSSKNPAWARISNGPGSSFRPNSSSTSTSSASLSIEEIEERLAGVPVYALSNPSEEFVLVSNVDSGKSLGLFCFKEEDAETLLQQMKSMDPGMRQGSKVVAVALNKVFQLKVDGVGFRLIPESAQIKNALNEMKKAGRPDESFSGVPVFQSRSLILRSQKRRYRPVFFRKEDLDKSLGRASQDQRRLNPALREGDLQVAVLEDIILGMQKNSKSEWDDVVFVPPGFDVSTDPSQK